MFEVTPRHPLPVSLREYISSTSSSSSGDFKSIIKGRTVSCHPSRSTWSWYQSLRHRSFRNLHVWKSFFICRHRPRVPPSPVLPSLTNSVSTTVSSPTPPRRRVQVLLQKNYNLVTVSRHYFFCHRVLRDLELGGRRSQGRDERMSLYLCIRDITRYYTLVTVEKVHPP